MSFETIPRVGKARANRLLFNKIKGHQLRKVLLLPGATMECLKWGLATRAFSHRAKFILVTREESTAELIEEQVRDLNLVFKPTIYLSDLTDVDIEDNTDLVFADTCGQLSTKLVDWISYASKKIDKSGHLWLTLANQRYTKILTYYKTQVSPFQIMNIKDFNNCTNTQAWVTAIIENAARRVMHHMSYKDITPMSLIFNKG